MERGQALTLLVESATALTPPPGVQEERAHRAFAVSLCAEGVALQSAARSCFPLQVRNVRPLDGASLRYRVEAAVPTWVAPSRYQLRARFPGADVEVAGSVVVGGVEQAVPHALERVGERLVLRASPGALVRVHAGPRGLALASLKARVFPLPAEEGAFRPGLVALVTVPASGVLLLEAAPQSPEAAPQIAGDDAWAGRAARFRLDPLAAGDHVFWWLGGERGAEGGSVQVVLEERGAARIQALRIDGTGLPALTERAALVRPRQGVGCAMATPERTRCSPLWALLVGMGLLAVARSWKLRAGRELKRSE